MASARYLRQIRHWEEAIHIQENYTCNLDYMGDNQIATGFELVELASDIL